MVHFAEINQASPPYSNFAVYWKSSNTEACATKLSKVLANNIGNRGREIGLRIYVRYCNLKWDIEKLDIGKLETTPDNLSKLNNIAGHEVVKNTVYNELVEKVNAIYTSGFVLKTQCNTEKSDIENKKPDTSGIGKMTDYEANVTDIEDKFLNVTGLASTSALNTVENKMQNVNDLLK